MSLYLLEARPFEASTVLFGTALIVVALTYLPAMALGQIVEHLGLVGG